MIILCVSIDSTFDDYGYLCDKLNSIQFNKLTCTTNKLVSRYAKEFNKPLQEFQINWGDLTAPNAIIKKNKFGKPYNYNAPADAASKVVAYATHVINFGKGEYNISKLASGNLVEIVVEEQKQETNTKKRYQF